MRVKDSQHLSVKPESTALNYLKEKEEDYTHLREAYDKLTVAFADAEKIPADIAAKLKRLGDHLKEFNRLLEEYRNFLKENGVDIV